MVSLSAKSHGHKDRKDASSIEFVNLSKQGVESLALGPTAWCIRVGTLPAPYLIHYSSNMACRIPSGYHGAFYDAQFKWRIQECDSMFHLSIWLLWIGCLFIAQINDKSLWDELWGAPGGILHNYILTICSSNIVTIKYTWCTTTVMVIHSQCLFKWCA